MKYYQLGEVDRAVATLDGILENPRVDYNAAYAVASAYAQLNKLPKVESALEKGVNLAPNQSEAWYNLAAVRATLNKPTEALQNLRRALELSDKARVQNTNAPDLRATLQRDARFSALRSMPEYKALVSPR